MKLKNAAFYILTEPTLKSRDLYACRVIEKIHSKNQTIYIHTDSIEEAQKFDTQLWTFRDISFVPHKIYSQDSDANANANDSILIGYSNLDVLPIKRDILINLALEIPLFYNQFNNIIEIVPNDNKLKTIARKHYKNYQDNLYKMENFNIN